MSNEIEFYLLIRTIEVRHRCKPGIIDRIRENRPELLLVGADVVVHKSYKALCQELMPFETASLIFPRTV